MYMYVALPEDYFPSYGVCDHYSKYSYVTNLQHDVRFIK